MRVANLAQSLLTRTQALDTQFRLQTTEQQISTGYKTSVFSGLGGESKKLLDFDRAKSGLETYMSTIQAAERRSTIMDAALTTITAIAQEVRADNFSTRAFIDDASVRQNVMTGAEEAINTTISALNAQFEGRYLFSGYEFDTKPINIDADTMIADTNAILAAAGFPPGTAVAAADIEAAIDEYLGINPVAAAGYYASNSSDTVSARIDENQELQYGLTADDAAFRNVFKGFLMTSISVERYDDLNQTSATEFETAYTDARVFIEQGFDETNQHVGQLGIRRQKLESTRIGHENTINILVQGISEIQDADVYKAITEFQRLQVQLQASYTVTAQLSNLSLVNFI